MKRVERVALMRVEHLDALRVQAAHEALIEPLGEWRDLRLTLRDDPVLDQRVLDPGLGEQAVERLDGACRGVDAHRSSPCFGLGGALDTAHLFYLKRESSTGA